jgi:signal transduction histidine kinase
MAKLIDLTVQKVKQICIELRPKLLDDIGLPGTISWLLSEFEKTTGIETNYNCTLKDHIIDSEKATTIYRVLMEALTNIYRHAQAQKLNVNLSRSETELVLKIQDNGKGISDEQVLSPRSLGIMGMRERVLFWGGSLKISGVSGKGTSLIVKIPDRPAGVGSD